MAKIMKFTSEAPVVETVRRNVLVFCGGFLRKKDGKSKDPVSRDGVAEDAGAHP